MDFGTWLAGVMSGNAQEPHPSTQAEEAAAAGASEASAGAGAAGASKTMAAPSSSAADALAAAVSAGDLYDKPARMKPQGTELKPSRDMFDIDAPRSSGESQPQLQVTPITLVKSDYRLQVLHQIAVNCTYFCYGLKAGQIRVLHRNTAQRVLFKDHTSMVTDMCFYNSSSNLLASCDQSGEVVIRKIIEAPEGEEPPIQQEILTRHAFNMSETATRRLAWHPQLDSLLAVAAADRVCLVNVPPTSGVAASPEFAAPAVPSAPMTDGSITSLAFSERGDILAASDSKGYVYVWLLSPEVIAAWASGRAPEPLPVDADMKFQAYEGGDFAAALDFLPSSEAQQQQEVLVTADAGARVLKLWTADTDLVPQCTYTLELVSSKEGPGAFFNHMLVQPNFNVVVLANTKRQQVYVLHARRDAAGAEFDYLSDFSVKQPILSMTTTTEPSFEDGSEVFHLYTVQTEAVQQYTLYPEVCFPAAESELPAAESTEVQEAVTEEKAPNRSDIMGGHLQGVAPDLPPFVPTSLAEHLTSAGSSMTTRLAPPSQGAEAPAAGELPPAPVKLLSPAALTSNEPPPQQPDSSILTTAHPQHRRTNSSTASDAASPFTGAALHADYAQSSPPQLVESFSHGHSRSLQGSTSSTPHVPHRALDDHAVEQMQDELEPHMSTSSGPVPMPPPPPSELLVKKLSLASHGSGSSFPLPGSQPSLSLPPRHPDESVDNGTVTAAAAAAAAALRVSSDSAPHAPAAQGDIAKVLALQQQLLAQLAASQRETVKQLKAELGKQSKASEVAVKGVVEAALKAHAKQVEQERAKEVKKEREEIAKLLAQASTTIVREVSAKLQESARSSAAIISTSLAASVSKAVADTLPAALSGGSTQQALEQALSNQLRTSLPKAISDSFSSSVIPSFERATQVMFNQIDTAFKSGLAEQLRGAGGVTADAADSLRKATAQITAAAQQMSAAASSSQAGGGRGPEAGSQLTSARMSVSQLEARQDPKTVISGLLRQADYQGAFNHALSTTDPETTMWLCKQIKPSTVFDTEPCPLSQPVLLSLVTHLAQQLSVDTEVKLAWVSEICPAIDPRNPQVAQHCRPVLEPIKSQLTVLARSSHGEVGKLAKTTVHLVNSLLHQ